MKSLIYLGYDKVDSTLFQEAYLQNFEQCNNATKSRRVKRKNFKKKSNDMRGYSKDSSYESLKKAGLSNEKRFKNKYHAHKEYKQKNYKQNLKNEEKENSNATKEKEFYFYKPKSKDYTSLSVFSSKIRLQL